MGNCTASMLVNGGGSDFEEDAVALCKERKRLLKSAVDRRLALSDAHHLYFLSLHSVAAAINLFVASHSSPPSLLLTLTETHTQTLTTTSTSTSTPSLLRQTPTEPKTESFEGGAKNKAEEQISCGYYFSGLPPMPPPSPMKDFGWDFFNPFDGVRAAEEAAMLTGLCRSSDEDLRVVREEEGIPELEEVEDEEAGKKGSGIGEVARVSGSEEVKERGLMVTEAPEKERELLDALRDIEDQFIRAYDCGKEVAKMLEVSQLHHHTDDTKENPSKLIQAITWHRSPSTQSSSNKSYISSSSKDTLSIESKSDLFDDYGGMESGSHSQTLGRLYAWEKKLYEEVKAGDNTRQVYEKKCLQLRNHEDAKGAESRSLDKIKSTVTDLYTSILVALRSIETISARIQKVRDEELQPQLIELLQGLMKTWKIMLESHKTQKQIISEVKSFSCPAYGKFCTDSQRQVTVQLEAELRNWRTCFMSYISAQREYVEALNGWLSKFVISHTRVSLAPPLLIISHNWLNSTKKLPDKSVSIAMKGFIKATRVLWVKQGEEQQQKRKVDGLAKELDRRVLSFQKAETKVLEMKLSDVKPEPDVRDRVEYLSERRELLDGFRRKVEKEKEKHQGCMKETQRVTLDGFKIGLSGIFESLGEFSNDCFKLYSELLIENDKGKDTEGGETQGKASCLEGSLSGEDDR